MLLCPKLTSPPENQPILNRVRLEKLLQTGLEVRLPIFGQNLVSEPNAVVANINIGLANNLLHQIGALSTRTSTSAPIWNAHFK